MAGDRSCYKATVKLPDPTIGGKGRSREAWWLGAEVVGVQDGEEGEEGASWVVIDRSVGCLSGVDVTALPLLASPGCPNSAYSLRLACYACFIFSASCEPCAGSASFPLPTLSPRCACDACWPRCAPIACASIALARATTCPPSDIPAATPWPLLNGRGLCRAPS